MFSVKPGRGPSLLGAIMGLVIGVPFVIFWITTASKMGAPGFMVFFGVGFLVFLVIKIVMGFYNATAQNRISEMDITAEREESDPFNNSVQKDLTTQHQTSHIEGAVEEKVFCPFCGTKLGQSFQFCQKCGKELPA